MKGISVLRGISSIISAIIIMLISISIIVFMNNYMNSLETVQDIIINNIDRRFKIDSENVELVEKDSLYTLKSNPMCPIKYIILYDNNIGNISILQIYNYSVNISKNLLKHNTELYAITCNGNIVKLYVHVFSNDSVGYYLSSIKWNLFQPGGKEFIDPTVCPIYFNEYNNSYGSIDVNATFSLYCYNRSGLVLDSPVLYFYNTFLVKGNNPNVVKLSSFLKGMFNIEYGTQNIALFFLIRVYDLLTDASISNISYPNILDLGAQLAVQGTSKINNSSNYIYAWNRYKYNIISGKFLVYLDHNIAAKHLTVNAIKVNQGVVITDRARIVAPSTLSSVKFHLNVRFFNNSSFKIIKIPLNLEVNYTVSNSSYNLIIKTENGTMINKKMNKTNILLIINKPIYSDKYITIVLEKLWLYNVLNEPAVSLLVNVTSKRGLLSILAYKTREYLRIFNDAYPLKPVIEPRIVQKYYDGKILGKGDSTELFIQGHYIIRYGGSPAHRFLLYLPYIVVATSNR